MILRSQIHEFECHKFVADASDLGLRPGEWPRSFDTDAGNGQPFLFSAFHKDGSGATYRQANGCILLRIIND